MASNSKILREIKLKEAAKKTYEIRKELKLKMKKSIDPKEKSLLCQELDKLPPAHRSRRRCCVCGRPRGITAIGICRIHLREFTAAGKLPGFSRRRNK